MAHIETDTRRFFECFPHLRSIELIWGTRECRAFLAGLMTDTRDGNRRGFDPATAGTILDLLDEHDARFPACVPEHVVMPWAHALG
jgi:hypothetical protein